MDTKKLKQKVLDLAIRGKLVPQDPNDEPASKLLERIYAEKQKLIAEGKIKKEKRSSFIFKGEDNSYYEKVVENGKETIRDITDEIPFDIPETWAWSRLGSVGTVFSGGTPSTRNNDYWNGNIPWITPADLTDYNDMYISSGRKNISELGLKESSACYIPTGSVIYSSRAPIGYIVISKNEITTNQGFKSIFPTIPEMNKYIYYVLKSLTPLIKKCASGTTFKEISASSFGNVLFPIPPVEEQKRIVSIIENLKNQIADINNAYNTLSAKIDQTKSKLLDLAIRGKLLPQNPNDEPASALLERIREEQESTKTKRKSIGSYIFKGGDNLYYEKIGSETKCIQDEIPFDIPANWAWCRLLEICKVYQPKTISTRQMVVDGEFVVFGANGIIGRYNEYNHKEAEVLITCRGATCGAINVSLPFSWINGNAMVISPLYENIPSKSFLELYLKGINMNEYITGTAQPQITREELSKMKLPIPPLEEQKRIVEYISKANNQLDSMLSE